MKKYVQNQNDFHQDTLLNLNNTANFKKETTTQYLESINNNQLLNTNKLNNEENKKTQRKL